MLYRRLGMKDYDSPRMVETQLDNTIKDENETLEEKIERNQMRIEGEAVKEATNYRDGGSKRTLVKDALRNMLRHIAKSTKNLIRNAINVNVVVRVKRHANARVNAVANAKQGATKNTQGVCDKYI